MFRWNHVGETLDEMEKSERAQLSKIYKCERSKEFQRYTAFYKFAKSLNLLLVIGS